MFSFSSIIRTVKVVTRLKIKTSGKLVFVFVVVALLRFGVCSEFVLEQEQVVGCRHSDHIFCRVPGRVQDLLVEVQTVNVDLVFPALAARADLAWFKHSLGFRDLSGSFERDLLPRVSVKHAEEVVVGASHDGRVITVPATLELVENTVIFVQ